MSQPDHIRAEMRAELHRRGWTQARLAQQLGIQTSAVAQLLNGHYGKIPQSLLNALDALDLEIIAVPKAKNQRE